MKNKYTVVSVLFFAVLLFGGLAAFLLPHRSFSENENRALSDKIPAAHFAEMVSGDWQEGMENFFTDQFFGRDFLCKLGSETKILFGARERSGAYLCKEGVLTEAVPSVDRKRFSDNLAKVKAFAEKYPSVSVMFVPSAAASERDLLPAYALTYPSDEMFDEAKDTLSDSCRFIDLRDALSNQTGLYYRTDHHWTYKGALQAYEAFCASSGREAEPFGHRKIADDFYGTLWSKTLNIGQKSDEIYAPDTDIDAQLYDADATSRKDKYTYFLGGNDAKVVLRNPAAREDKTILLIKDSFANSFVPYLTKTYQNIILVDLRYFNERLSKLIETENVDEILFLYSMTSFCESNDLGRLKL